jgi:hypothetical protein
MVTVRIIVDRGGIHDGLGNVHQIGDTPTLPLSVAEIFLERGLATLVTTDPSAASIGS